MTKERVQNAKDALEAHQRLLQVARTDYKDPTILERQISALDEQIESLLKKRDELQEKYDTREERYHNACDRQVELQQQLKIERNREKVERFKKLKAEMDALN